MERSSQDKMTDMFINNDVKMKRSSQDKMTGIFINPYYNKDVKFLLSFIKYASMSWKGNCYLNFGKKIISLVNIEKVLLTTIHGKNHV